MTTTVTSVAELTALTGKHLGYSEWREITQEQINTFADATDDHQWIHVDAERAAAGPFGTTIAHGFLTLSLLVPMWSEILHFDGVRLGINYGLNKVRFPVSGAGRLEDPRRCHAGLRRDRRRRQPSDRRRLRRRARRRREAVLHRAGAVPLLRLTAWISAASERSSGKSSSQYSFSARAVARCSRSAASLRAQVDAADLSGDRLRQLRELEAADALVAGEVCLRVLEDRARDVLRRDMSGSHAR